MIRPEPGGSLPCIGSIELRGRESFLAGREKGLKPIRGRPEGTAGQTSPDGDRRQNETQGCRSRIHSEFEQVVRPHLVSLYRLAASILGPDEGWDAVQEVLVQVWESGELPPDHVDRWLRRIVWNRSLDILRGTRARLQRVECREEELDRVGCDADPSHELHLADLRRSIQEAVDSLPANFRDVVELHAYGDLDYAQMAEELGLPVGTVRSRLHRARATLQRKLMGGSER